jgi:hypothetical protein
MVDASVLVGLRSFPEDLFMIKIHLIRSLACLLILLVAGHSEAQSPLIVNHTAVQQFSSIPDYWLEQAKALTLHYAHTSHGGSF